MNEPVQPELPLDMPDTPEVPVLSDRVWSEMADQVMPGWRRGAECGGFGDDTWFPDRAEDAWIPVAVCRVCPVARSCLAYALRTGVDGGIWGGTSEAERELMVVDLDRGAPVGAVLDAAVPGDSSQAA